MAVGGVFRIIEDFGVYVLISVSPRNRDHTAFPTGLHFLSSPGDNAGMFTGKVLWPSAVDTVD